MDFSTLGSLCANDTRGNGMRGEKGTICPSRLHTHQWLAATPPLAADAVGSPYFTTETDKLIFLHTAGRSGSRAKGITRPVLCWRSPGLPLEVLCSRIDRLFHGSSLILAASVANPFPQSLKHYPLDADL